jgi:hypothetical protein
MGPYQKRTNSPQMLAVMADRDRVEGITNGLGRKKCEFTPGKPLGAANEQTTKLRRPPA